jgi:hypothetical protein
VSHHFDSAADRADGRINPCDLYAFPATPGATALILTVNPDDWRRRADWPTTNDKGNTIREVGRVKAIGNPQKPLRHYVIRTQTVPLALDSYRLALRTFEVGDRPRGRAPGELPWGGPNQTRPQLPPESPVKAQLGPPQPSSPPVPGQPGGTHPSA